MEQLHGSGGPSALPDSGKRQHFSTGSQRDTRDGKGRYDLLPAHGISRIAKHFEAGAIKYEPRNWEKGQPLSRYLDSALRHCFNYLANDTEEDHLAAAAWNLLCAMETENRIKRELLPVELADMPNPYLALELRTSKEWQGIFPHPMVLDPDGWDRQNWEYSWSQEEITYNEYQSRLCRSTVSHAMPRLQRADRRAEMQANLSKPNLHSSGCI